MARKIWAYAKDVHEQFIYNKQLEKLEIFYIWDVLKLKQQHPEAYSGLKFYSTEFDEINRQELIPTEYGFFRYQSDEVDKNRQESIYHSTAMLVLQEMSEINFTIDNDNYNFRFSKFLVEPCLKFQHFDKNEEKYYPDLIGYFGEDCELYDKWNGCLAIEVVFTNPCYQKKINSFEKNHIPIIEVSISKKLKLDTEFCGKINFTVDEVKKYYHALKKIFAKKVYGKIRSDPVSKKYHQNKINNLEILYQQTLLELENQQLKQHSNSQLYEQYAKLNQEYKKLQANMSNLNQMMSDMQQREWILNTRLNHYLNMGFWQRLKFLLQIPIE